MEIFNLQVWLFMFLSMREYQKGKALMSSSLLTVTIKHFRKIGSLKARAERPLKIYISMHDRMHLKKF